MSTLDDPHLLALLHDDVPSGDLTTQALGMGLRAGQLSFHARQPMTVCATEEALRLFELAGARATLLLPSGTPTNAGDLLLEAHGSAASLHAAAAVLRHEFSPITDMRATADYRRPAIGNLLIRLWNELESNDPSLRGLVR